MSLFLCPSEDEGLLARRWVGANLHILRNGGFNRYPRFSEPQEQAVLGRAHYAANGGFWGQAQGRKAIKYRGVFSERSERGFRDMQDGASYTLLFGESICSESNEEFWAWISVGYVTTRFGFGARDWRTFSSRHPGGIVQFAFGDGSTHKLDDTIDLKVLQQLGGIADGAAVDRSAY